MRRTPFPAPAAAPVEGEVLAGKYCVERVLGAGGMGIVVAARHVHLNERVALKFLLPEIAQSPEIVARFLREAQTAARIKSEHVARVFDVGTLENGAPYMVMEHLVGRDLGAVLAEQGRLSIPDAIDYVLQASEAIAEAHALGLIHRDLKPSNLFITQRADGSTLVKVLDFGISKAIAGAAPITTPPQNLTTTGGMIGSPLYMSPEQVRNAKTVDARADVWSLGVILHELLAGAPPFAGDTMTAVLAAIVADPPASLRAARLDAPASLEALIARCLEKDPQRRVQDVAQLAEGLAPFAEARSRVSIDRVAKTLGRHTSSMPVVDSSPSGRVGAHTASQWSRTHHGGKRSTRVAAGIATVLGLVGAAAVVVTMVRHAASRETPAQQASAASAPATPVASIASKPVDPSAIVPTPDPPRAAAPEAKPEAAASAMPSAPAAADAGAPRAPAARRGRVVAPNAPPRDDLGDLINDRR